MVDFIMNVGPTGRGVIDERTEERLAFCAKWMEANCESISNVLLP